MWPPHPTSSLCFSFNFFNSAHAHGSVGLKSLAELRVSTRSLRTRSGGRNGRNKRDALRIGTSDHGREGQANRTPVLLTTNRKIQRRHPSHILVRVIAFSHTFSAFQQVFTCQPAHVHGVKIFPNEMEEVRNFANMRTERQIATDIVSGEQGYNGSILRDDVGLHKRANASALMIGRSAGYLCRTASDPSRKQLSREEYPAWFAFRIGSMVSSKSFSINMDPITLTFRTVKRMTLCSRPLPYPSPNLHRRYKSLHWR